MIVGRLIPAGTGLAYHEARKRAALAALTPATPSAQVAAAEALFADADVETGNVAEKAEVAVETTVVETPAE